MAVNPLIKQRRPGPGRPFQKGQSGNPQSRPAGSRDAATRLAEAMLGDEAPPPPHPRTLLDFAYGGDRGLLKAAFQTAAPPVTAPRTACYCAPITGG
jgi:hypothetical protein